MESLITHFSALCALDSVVADALLFCHNSLVGRLACLLPHINTHTLRVVFLPRRGAFTSLLRWVCHHSAVAEVTWAQYCGGWSIWIDGCWRQKNITTERVYIFIHVAICTHCNYLRRRSLNNHVHYHHYHPYQPFNFNFTWNITFSLELFTFTFIFTLTELFFYLYLHLYIVLPYLLNLSLITLYLNLHLYLYLYLDLLPLGYLVLKYLTYFSKL